MQMPNHIPAQAWADYNDFALPLVRKNLDWRD
jgi:hypothetical protein